MADRPPLVYPEETRVAVTHSVLYNLLMRVKNGLAMQAPVVTFAMTEPEMRHLASALTLEVSAYQELMFPTPADSPSTPGGDHA